MKPFASGAGLIDRALVTAGGEHPLLFDLDLRAGGNLIDIDHTDWKAPAFRKTNTAKVTLRNLGVPRQSLLCGQEWYLSRPGFWNGACSPASCWTGNRPGRLVAHSISVRSTYIGAPWCDGGLGMVDASMP